MPAQKTVSQIGAGGVYIGPTTADESPLEPGVWLLPEGAIDVSPPDVPGGRQLAWNGQIFELVPLPEPPPPPPPPPPPTQFELDERRYTRRAEVKDALIAYMAADNMSRVRSGVWTVPQLVSLLDDPAIVAAQGFMQTLSFELAAQNIAAASSPLMTPEIKADWVARLTTHFYLVP